MNSVQGLAQDSNQPFGWKSAESAVESPRRFFIIRRMTYLLLFTFLSGKIIEFVR